MGTRASGRAAGLHSCPAPPEAGRKKKLKISPGCDMIAPIDDGRERTGEVMEGDADGDQDTHSCLERALSHAVI